MLNAQLIKKQFKGKRFIIISSEIFKLKLSSSAFMVFLFYLSHKDTFHPSIRFTAKKLNLSPKTVIKANKELLSFNIISVYEQGDINLRTIYKFNPLSEWKYVNKKIKYND